jgi:hypothetical protein
MDQNNTGIKIMMKLILWTDPFSLHISAQYDVKVQCMKRRVRAPSYGTSFISIVTVSLTGTVLPCAA